MSPITTHILDTSRGRPAVGVAVQLARANAAGGWDPLATGVTNQDGRIPNLLPPATSIEAGVYQLTFATAEYFQHQGVDSFYPHVTIVFAIRQPDEHYHVPLLLNPFGYSTYRGS